MPEPISTGEARQALRIDADDDDALIDRMITTAREWVEDRCSHILMRREIVRTFASFGGAIDLAIWPVVSVDAIAYLDASGAALALTADDFVLANSGRPARIWPASGQRFPVTASRADAVTVTMTAGYLPEDVPAWAKDAMFVLLTARYNDREGGEITERAERSAARIIRGKRRSLA